jgi:hypothetical protein
MTQRIAGIDGWYFVTQTARAIARVQVIVSR